MTKIQNLKHGQAPGLLMRHIPLGSIISTASVISGSERGSWVWHFGILVIYLVIFSQRLISLWLRNLFVIWCLYFGIFVVVP